MRLNKNDLITLYLYYLYYKNIISFVFLVEQKKQNLTKKCDISLRKFKNIESPKMVSKRLYGHYLRSYEQIKNFQI